MPTSMRFFTGGVLLGLLLLVTACQSSSTETVSVSEPTIRPDPTATPVPSPEPQEEAEATEDSMTAEGRLAIFNRVWTLVDDEFAYEDFRGTDWAAVGETYRPLIEADQPDDDFYALLQAMVAELDNPATYLQTPQEAAREAAFQDQAADFAGIGVFFSETDRGLRVLRTVLGGPAAAAGLVPGDLITAVDGVQVKALNENNPLGVTEAVLGEAGTPVTLSIEPPESSPKDVEIIRQPIDFASVSFAESRVISEAGIGILTLHSFGPSGVDDEVQDHLENLAAEQELAGLVIDLRTNGGGQLVEMRETVALFSGGGVIGRTGNVPVTVPANRVVTPFDNLPIAVVIGSETVGAAEIFAIGLQHLRGAAIVGSPSGGFTEIADTHRLPHGATLFLVHSVYELPDGSLIEGVGIQPDHLAETDWGRFQTADDPVIEKALELMPGSE